MPLSVWLHACSEALCSSFLSCFLGFRRPNLYSCFKLAFFQSNDSPKKKPPKWQKNDLVSGGHGLAWPSLELAWILNWVDRLRTSADKRMRSGRRAVVMRKGRRTELLDVKLGCPRSRCRAVVSDVLCVRSYVYVVCVCVYMCMCVCVRT